MDTEIEAKFLNVSHDNIRGLLKELSATLVSSQREMKRKNFDYPDHRLEKVGGWVRLRNEGDKVTLAYKQLNDRTLHGMKEVSADVNSFGAAEQLLLAIGLAQTSYQETRRESWLLDGVQIELDEWPWIEPFIEIEGPSEVGVRTAAQKLGLDWQSAVFGSVEILYMTTYNVSEEEVDSWPEIAFGPIPDWLEAKRK